MNRTTRAGLGLTLGALLILVSSVSSFALTPVQFTGTETNAQLQRIITLVVVPPSTEQQRGTNIVIQPNVTVKPTTTNYPVVYLTSADYDVYLAGIKQFFRIAVPDTNIVQRWDLLVKGGLTTYNYTNPIPQIFLTNGAAPVFITNLYSTTIISDTLISTNNTFNYITNTELITTNLTIYYPGGETNLNLTPLRLVQSDINDAMASVPDGVGALFNTGGGGFSWYNHFVTDLNGKLTNASFWGLAEFDELEVDRAFLTNTFTFLTNVSFLTTDGNGQVIPGSGVITNSTTIVQNFSSTYITNLTEYSTNLYSSNIVVYTLNPFWIIFTNSYGQVGQLYETDANYPNLTFDLGDTNGRSTFFLLTTNVAAFTESVSVRPTSAFVVSNATPLTVAYIDSLHQLTNIPNAAGYLFNNGAGGMLWTTAITNTTQITSNLFVTNFYATTIYGDTNYLTNAYFVTGKGNTLIVTNVAVYGVQTNFNIAASSAVITKADQVLTNAVNAHGVFTNTATGPPSFGLLQNTELQNSTVTVTGTGNQVGVSGSPVALGGTVTLSTPSVFIAPGTLAAVTSMTNQAFAAVGVVTNDANGKLYTTPLVDPALLNLIRATNNDAAVTNEVTRQINSGTNIYTPLGTALSGIESATNLSYIMKTNNGGGNVLIAGSPGTASTGYLTNITADTTLAAATFWSAGLSTIQFLATCSGGANKQLKLPANVIGCGPFDGVDLNGTGITVTNGEGWWLEWRCIPGVKTNLFGQHTK